LVTIALRLERPSLVSMLDLGLGLGSCSESGKRWRTVWVPPVHGLAIPWLMGSCNWKNASRSDFSTSDLLVVEVQLRPLQRGRWCRADVGRKAESTERLL